MICRKIAPLCALAAAVGALPGRAAPQAVPRLVTPVTLQEPHIRLDRLLEKLSVASGVRYRIEPEARRQWLAIFVKDAPLKEVHDHLEALLVWDWVASGRGEQTVYRFMRGQRYREARARMRAQAEQAFEDHVAFLLRASDWSEDQLAGMRDRYPLLTHYLRDPQSSAIVKSYGQLLSDVRSRVLRGGEFSSDFSRLNPDLQQQLRNVLLGVDQRSGRTEYGPRTITRVRFFALRSEEGEPESLGVACQLSGLRLPVEFYGAPFLATFELREPSPRQRQERMRAMQQDVELRAPLPSAPQPPPAPPKTDPRIPGITEALARLYHRKPLALLADLYPWDQHWRMGNATNRLPDDWLNMPLWRALDQVSENYFHSWRRVDGWYHFRYDHWYWMADREWDLPPESAGG